MCYWFYKDKYFEFYKKKGVIAGFGTNYSYKSSNYIFCVINLEKSLLYFYEYDS